VVHEDTTGVDHVFLLEEPVRARTTMAMVANVIGDAVETQRQQQPAFLHIRCDELSVSSGEPAGVSVANVFAAGR
jgi:hypothetical protein